MRSAETAADDADVEHGWADAGWTLTVAGSTKLLRWARPTDIEIPLRPKERSVLAALAADHPDPVPVDRVAERVWGHDPPRNAVTSIRNHVARIRRVAPGLVRTVGNAYRLDDAVRLSWHNPGSRHEVVLRDLADTDEVLVRRHIIAERLATTIDAELAIAASGDPSAETIERLRLAVEAEPYREVRWALLALVQARSGRRRDAMLTLQEVRRRLADVGLEPASQLLGVEQMIAADGPIERRALLDLASPVEIAPIIHPHHDEPFVGRGDELRHLDDAWTDTCRARRPRLVVVEGPAGSGKTRLVDRFVQQLAATAPGTRIVWGRHRTHANRAYGALAEAVTRLAETEPGLFDRRSHATGLLQLVAPAALGDPAPLRAVPPTPDPLEITDRPDSVARTQFGRELTQLVQQLGRRPTIWLLDDVQWASPDSLSLLEEAFDGSTGSILLIATARLDGGPSSDLYGSIGRVLPTSTVSVGPLAPDDLVDLVRTSDGSSVDTNAVAALHRRTGGLALYASEIARVARLTGRLELDAVPIALREWMRHRIDDLDVSITETLRVAAVLDDSVDIRVLAHATSRSGDELTRECDRLIGLGLLTVDQRTGRISFAHELTRDVVRESIGPMSRSAVERRVGEAILEHDPLAHDRIAYHFARALDHRAFPHAVASGERALALGAWEHARSMFEIATERADGPAERGAALVGWGRALLGAGDAATARTVLGDAIDLAQSADMPELHARVALALVGRAGRGAMSDEEHAQADVLRGALAHLERHPAPGPDADALRCDIERELAIALLLTDAEEERTALLLGSLRRAGELDPPRPVTLANALLSVRYALFGGADLTERLDNTSRVLEMPHDEIDDEIRAAAWTYRHEDLLRACRHEDAERALLEAEHAVAAYPHPYWTWAVRTWRSMWHLLMGDVEKSEAVATEALALRQGVAGAAACYGVNLVNIRLHQGRAHEVVPLLEHAVASRPDIAAYRAVLALCASEAGDTALASASLRWFTEQGCDNLPNDTSRLLALTVLAHTAADVDDADAGAVIAPLLEPYDGQWAVISAYGGGGATWGPIAHALARLARLAGDDAAATRSTTLAVEQAAWAPLALSRIDR
jgi:DNA-binding SARP family transcriptional activator